MTDAPQIDTEKLKQEAIEAAQQALIAKLQGDKPRYSWEEKGESQPSNYDELFSEVKKQVPTLTEEEVRAKAREEYERIEQEKKDHAAKRDEETKKAEELQLEEKRKSFDMEWSDLVQQGKMPAPSKEVQDRIDKGEKLTMDEILADEGLKARLELAKLVGTTKKTAKVAFYEDFNQEPAGATAPVLGGRPSTVQSESQELDYERDVKPGRKRLFGW